jgi:hypothetical protein
MNRFLITFGLAVCACTQPVSALVVTIDTDTPDTFAFDVVWGPDSDADNYRTPVTAYAGLWSGSPSVEAVVDGPAVIEIWTRAADSSWTSFTQFLFGTPLAYWETPGPGCGTRTFTHAYVNDFDGPQPTSVSATADGFGMHVVFEPLPTGTPPTGGDDGSAQPAPDGGSPLMLLGSSLAVMGLARFRRA